MIKLLLLLIMLAGVYLISGVVVSYVQSNINKTPMDTKIIYMWGWEAVKMDRKDVKDDNKKTEISDLDE